MSVKSHQFKFTQFCTFCRYPTDEVLLESFHEMSIWDEYKTGLVQNNVSLYRRLMGKMEEGILYSELVKVKDRHRKVNAILNSIRRKAKFIAHEQDVMRRNITIQTRTSLSRWLKRSVPEDNEPTKLTNECVFDRYRPGRITPGLNRRRIVRSSKNIPRKPCDQKKLVTISDIIH